jgi:hypothetical protein
VHRLRGEFEKALLEWLLQAYCPWCQKIVIVVDVGAMDGTLRAN